MTLLLDVNTGVQTGFPTIRTVARSLGLNPGIRVFFGGGHWWVGDTSIADGGIVTGVNDPGSVGRITVFATDSQPPDGIRPIDERWNAGPITSVNVAALPSPAPNDPIRTGVRAHAPHWGAAGEQINMFSGNLNFTIPLVQAIGRNGWNVGFSLSYNSQLWRQDGTTTFKLGADVGYGFGWRLLAGSVVPVWIDPYTIGHYIYTDSSGAEYKLDVRNGDQWSDRAGIYVRYNSASNRLQFSDGSFWLMGCISSDTDDGGTRYPTLMQDANGNQIAIRYMPAVGGSTPNTSARIQEIEDVRAVDTGGGAFRTYQFAYDNDPVPHLISITNSIGSGESYAFSYHAPQTLYGPFTPAVAFGTTRMLHSITLTGPGLSHFFAQSDSGELTSVLLPYGAQRWYSYSTFTFAGNRSVREVTDRTLMRHPGAPHVQYHIWRSSADATQPVHTVKAVVDFGSGSQEYWAFYSSADWRRGLVQTELEASHPAWDVKIQRDFTWSANSTGHPYMSQVQTTLDPGAAHQKISKTTQTVDAYGNVTETKEFQYGNLTTPARRTNCTYTGYPASFHVRLPLTCTVTNGTQTVSLFTATYDTGTLAGVSPWPRLLASNVGAQRGNLTSLVTPYLTYTHIFNQFGGVVTAQDSQGRRMDTQYDASKSFAVPSVLTPNSNPSLTSTMSWNGFLGLTAQTKANTFSTSIGYDTFARPASTTTPHGATWTLTYTNSPATKTASFGSRWTKTHYDGLGREIKVESGHGSTVVSVVETEYGPCACSPIGKVQRISQPYKPGDPMYWTTYTYDAMGRTTSVAQPGNSGTTTYVYLGNTVTVTDPAGRWKKFTMNAFGNLTQVNEPNPAGGADYVTTYTYNFRDKLTQVSMPRPTGTQKRTFTYDTLTHTRLVQTVFPETGTTTYTYNADGKLTSKTDARNKRIEYGWDALGRLASDARKTWNGSAWVTDSTSGYSYDTAPIVDQPGYVAHGLPASVNRGGLVESYAYDSRGRMARKTSFGLTFGFEWNADGQLWKIQYPRTPQPNATTYDPNDPSLSAHNEPWVQYQFDLLGRPTGATVSHRWGTFGTTQSSVASGAQYNAANQMTQWSYYDGSLKTETRAYNLLNQLTRITLPGSMDVEYRYSATANDGRITSQKDWLSGEDVQYQYDSLGRLTQAQTVGPEWGQSFSYDGFSNLWGKSVTKGSATTLSLTVSASTNRITSADHVYDAAGNLTQMPFGAGTQTQTFDHENRVMSLTNANGTQTNEYNHAGQRVKRTAGGATDYYFYGVRGELLGRYRQKVLASGTYFVYEEMFFYFGGRLAARLGPGVNTGTYQTALPLQRDRLDRLGSVGDGSKYFPYGEERTPTANDAFQFATYYRDGVTGLDYAQQRYYSSVQGRFLSADPYMASAGVENPGSWNRYAYVEGNPVNFVDPSGLFMHAASLEMHDLGSGGGGGGWWSGFGWWFRGGRRDDVQPEMPWGVPDVATGIALPPDPCDEIDKEIDHLVNAVRGSSGSDFKGLDQRLRQMTRMSRDDPEWKGHVEQIEYRRRQLQDVLKRWNDNDCGDPPSSVGDVVVRPIFSYEDIQVTKHTERALRIGIGAVFGYAGYRVIRLLPSLLPPLWWTLPANVAVP